MRKNVWYTMKCVMNACKCMFYRCDDRTSSALPRKVVIVLLNAECATCSCAVKICFAAMQLMLPDPGAENQRAAAAASAREARLR